MIYMSNLGTRKLTHAYSKKEVLSHRQEKVSHIGKKKNTEWMLKKYF